MCYEVLTTTPQSDLRLVTTNAKTFNPPGTIYHTEADRIEAFALEHIAKAAATVIEYETDWNIEIEKDEDPVNVDDDDASGMAGTPVDRTRGTPMDVDESRAGSPFPAQAGGKRVKGKRLPGPLSESIEADGGLPGAKDGLGAFPPCSDWAELMLALKLKGASTVLSFPAPKTDHGTQASDTKQRRSGCVSRRAARR